MHALIVPCLQPLFSSMHWIVVVGRCPSLLDGVPYQESGMPLTIVSAIAGCSVPSRL